MRIKQINKKEDCPLCETTKEAITMLKPNENSESEDKKSPRKTKAIFLYLMIIFGIIVSYKMLSGSSVMRTATSNDLIQGQSININTSEKNKEASPQINASAPDFALEDVSGNKVALSSFHGEQPVLLVFWATWCGYCAKELPDIKIFTKRYQGKIKVLAVDSGEPKETIRDYIKEKDINFLMLIDEQREVWNKYLVRGTPSHFLIGKDGKIITMRPGLASLVDLETMLLMVPVE